MFSTRKKLRQFYLIQMSYIYLLNCKYLFMGTQTRLCGTVIPINEKIYTFPFALRSGMSPCIPCMVEKFFFVGWDCHIMGDVRLWNWENGQSSFFSMCELPSKASLHSLASFVTKKILNNDITMLNTHRFIHKYAEFKRKFSNIMLFYS